MKVKNPISISILLPVYNAPYHIRNLFRTLKRYTNIALLKELIIGDDASDELTQTVLKDIAQNTPFKVRIVRQEKNVGYLHNVNNLYQEATTDIVIILNTDTLVPEKWLERIKAAFENNDTAALATPFSTNATNLTILPREGQSWVDIDRCLSTLSPQYPNAHTAVGFCLAVRKSLLKEKNLLDTDYKYGYWEETDLHYRVLSKGFRSIVIDNLLIYHARGSGSFSLKHDLSKVSDQNKMIFYSRWGKIHTEHEINYHQTNPYNYVKTNYRLNYIEKNQSINILFVLPAFIKGSGGIQLVINLAEYLNTCGLRAALYVYGAIDEDYINYLASINPWRSIEELENNVASVDVIFATSYDSVPYARNLATHYNSKISYFVQGPEALFSCGNQLEQILNDYQTISPIVTVSTFLKHYLSQLGVSKSFPIPMGCDTYKFYVLETYEKRKVKSIAACLRLGEPKGTGILLHAAMLAKKAGFDIHFFGKHSPDFNLPPELGYYHGDLTPQEICKLFNQVGFYLDLSYFEGLGLLPLEAANCGAIPIISHNGGADFVFTHAKNAFFIENIFIENDFFKTLYNYDIPTLENIRIETLMIGAHLSEDRGIITFEHFLFEHFSKCFSINEGIFINIHQPEFSTIQNYKNSRVFISVKHTVWFQKTRDNLKGLYRYLFRQKMCTNCKKAILPIKRSKKSIFYRIAQKLFFRYKNDIRNLFYKAKKEANKDIIDKLNILQSEMLLHRRILNNLIKHTEDD